MSLPSNLTYSGGISGPQGISAFIGSLLFDSEEPCFFLLEVAQLKRIAIKNSFIALMK
jgi:hypothetical protein